MKLQYEHFEESGNPLDSVEEILIGNDWTYDRQNDEELVVHVSGEKCNYVMTFIWQEEFQALQYMCTYDMFIPYARAVHSADILQNINGRVWLGHFEIPEETNAPQFRYTSLFRGTAPAATSGYIADLVEIAMAECERNFDVFSMLSGSEIITDAKLDLMMSDTVGHA